MNRIRERFAQLRAEGRAALMPYITAGHPSLDVTEALLPAMARAGADLIELGIPFSDPLADGPTIQKAAQRALEAGVTIAAVHAMVERLRRQGLTVPVLYMVYYNCIFSHGEERFLDDARAAGIDGLIVPDLPLEESASLRRLAEERGIDLVYLLAPTSTPERIAATAEHSRSFIYCVSLTGVTGARERLSSALKPMLQRIRAVTDLPLAVGFGVSTPEQAQEVARLADGVIVGSALVDRIDCAHTKEEAVAAASEYLQALRHALDAARSGSVNVI